MAVFDRASRLVRSMFHRPYASIILVHNGEVWRSRYADVLPTEDPLTEAVLKGGELFWVEDGRQDPRFAQNPLVTGPPFLRFTVAVPIRLQDGSTPGVLSVSGTKPEPFDSGQGREIDGRRRFPRGRMGEGASRRRPRRDPFASATKRSSAANAPKVACSWPLSLPTSTSGSSTTSGAN